MQKGRIYKRGGWWMFRYKVPEMSAGKKIWRDRYEKLATLVSTPRRVLSSATAC